MGAAQVWQQSGAKWNFETYRIILTRYSSKFPADVNGDGSLTPRDHDELDWVISSVPRSPQIAGCGSWGLDVVSAVTGKGVQQSS